MNKHMIPLAVLLLFVLAGCSALIGRSTSTSESIQPANTQAADPNNPQQGTMDQPVLKGLNREALESYSSTFTVKFEGASRWLYQLKTRKSATLREFSLHIEGIDPAKNPGDIRLVTDGKTSWMIGPGTEQECVQFPNNEGMDPTLIYPETLVPEKELGSIVSYAGEDTVAGVPNLHFTGSADSAGGWKEVGVQVWQDRTSKALLKFILQASGNDKIFGTGEGRLSAIYEAAGLGSAGIEPVQGCEISAPLPDSAVKFVRFPGLASFESAAGAEEIINFYQTRLPQDNWTEAEAPAKSDNTTVLSYKRGAEGVQIQIVAIPEGGTKVKLIFLK